LDLSRQRLAAHLLCEEGRTLELARQVVDIDRLMVHHIARAQSGRNQEGHQDAALHFDVARVLRLLLT